MKSIKNPRNTILGTTLAISLILTSVADVLADSSITAEAPSIVVDPNGYSPVELIPSYEWTDKKGNVHLATLKCTSPDGKTSGDFTFNEDTGKITCKQGGHGSAIFSYKYEDKVVGAPKK